MFASGRCLCGAVTFTVAAAPVRMGQCHCEQCRRSAGGGHAVQAFFARSDIAITGQTSAYESTADSGSTRKRYFCPTCGSRLFSETSRAPDLMGITAGAFDDSSWYKPQTVVYTAQRPVWDVVDPAIPSFPGPRP